MEANAVLPKRLVNYIHETGVRALDNLAETISGDQPAALQSLVSNWKAMTTEEKEQFVDRVAIAVVNVIAASALVPVGRKLARRAAKSVRKTIKKQKKALKKAVAASKKTSKKKKSAKAA
ncbi:MAG TPA: hypothetical protein VKU62_09300 [Thermoanaerobaculia bacterium]|nr:hypothetical protein [Thermoanaerobaculia bacterium]